MSGKRSLRGASDLPLGPVFLGRVVVPVALFLIYAVYLQFSVLFKSRRHARQRHMQRELSEAPRFRFFDDPQSLRIRANQPKPRC